MNANLADILDAAGMEALIHEIKSEESIHQWQADCLVKSLAHKAGHRWFHQWHLHDMCCAFALSEQEITTAFGQLVNQRVLISASCPAKAYISKFTPSTNQIAYCYRMEPKARLAWEKELIALKAPLVAGDKPFQPSTTDVLPAVVVEDTRGYIEDVVVQCNGCYERRWFDACAVMIRKLVEILIIAVYEQESRQTQIKGGDGNFLMLSGLIDRLLADTSFHLGRETKAGLPRIKELGDRAAHNRYFVASKADVDKVIGDLRVIVPELLHRAALKK
jgi:hypothetical protein